MITVLLILLAVIVAVWLLGLIAISAYIVVCVLFDIRAEHRVKRDNLDFQLAAVDREWAKRHGVGH